MGVTVSRFVYCNWVLWAFCLGWARKPTKEKIFQERLLSVTGTCTLKISWPPSFHMDSCPRGDKREGSRAEDVLEPFQTRLWQSRLEGSFGASYSRPMTCPLRAPCGAPKSLLISERKTTPPTSIYPTIRVEACCRSMMCCGQTAIAILAQGESLENSRVVLRPVSKR